MQYVSTFVELGFQGSNVYSVAPAPLTSGKANPGWADDQT